MAFIKIIDSVGKEYLVNTLQIIHIEALEDFKAIILFSDGSKMTADISFEEFENSRLNALRLDNEEIEKS